MIVNTAIFLRRYRCGVHHRRGGVDLSERAIECRCETRRNCVANYYCTSRYPSTVSHILSTVRELGGYRRFGGVQHGVGFIRFSDCLTEQSTLKFRALRIPEKYFYSGSGHTFSCVAVDRYCAIQDRETMAKLNSKSTSNMHLFMPLFTS